MKKVALSLAVLTMITSSASSVYASNRIVETRERCFTRAYYNPVTDARMWNVELCENFTYTTDDDGIVTVNPNGDPHINWTSHNFSRAIFSASDSDAWTIDNGDGTFSVHGYVKVVGKLFPTGDWNVDVREVPIYSGFVVGPNFSDYPYPYRVDFWGDQENSQGLDLGPDDPYSHGIYRDDAWDKA